MNFNPGHKAHLPLLSSNQAEHSMSTLFKRIAQAGVLALGLTAAGAQAQTAICYNCPTEWADWGTQLRAIKEHTGISIPADNKNSGQSLAQLVAEKSNPVADIVYLGISFAAQAQKEGVVTPYKPAHWDAIPADLKDPEGNWFTVHSGTMGFMVNVDALDGKPIPKSWADLLKPEYRGLVGYLDPSSAFVGYVAAMAANLAHGGTVDNMQPGLDYLKTLQKNDPIVPKQTSYARLLSGEIGILLDYDFNAYRAKHKDGANVEFVIPEEGTIAVPYVMSLVANSPNPDNGKKALDFVMSDEGQAIWARAFLRPVRPEAMPKDIEALFLPASDYARVKSIDYARMAEVQRDFSDRYLQQVQ